MKMLSKTLAVGAGVLGGLGGLGVAGLLLPPPSYPTIVGRTSEAPPVEIPDSLPAPVRRYLRAVGGERLPVADSFVMWGRLRMRRGVWLNGRWRAYHVPGRHFQRPLELTWFGLPIMRGVDQSIDGQGTMLVGDQRTTDDETSQGALAILWLEVAATPGIYATDPRLRWEGLGEKRARLVYPSLFGEDYLHYDFDRATGLPTRVGTMRYKRADGPKFPWHSDILEWRRFGSVLMPGKIAVEWEDEGRPWSYWTTDGLAYNVDVSAQIEAGRAINRG